VIRVLIAARAAMTRAGLETLVASAPGLQLAGSYPDAAAAEALHPDVLLAEGAPRMKRKRSAGWPESRAS